MPKLQARRSLVGQLKVLQIDSVLDFVPHLDSLGLLNVANVVTEGVLVPVINRQLPVVRSKIASPGASISCQLSRTRDDAPLRLSQTWQKRSQQCCY